MKTEVKTLFLLRHAKTLPADEGGRDRDRALTAEGLEDARALGRLVNRRGWRPDLALCSPAARTRQTWEALDLRAGNVLYPEKLYTGGRGEMLHLIQNAGDEAAALMIVGHNPGLYELAAMLAEFGEEPLAARLSGGYAPGTLAVFECPAAGWGHIRPGGNRLAGLFEPLDYNGPATPARWT